MGVVGEIHNFNLIKFNKRPIKNYFLQSINLLWYTEIYIYYKCCESKSINFKSSLIFCNKTYYKNCSQA